MLALASHDDAPRAMSSRRIAREWQIPQRFLTRVLRRLAERGLIEPVLGRHGGYRLARPATSITLLDVIDAVETTPAKGICVLRGGPCQRGGRCAVHDVFTAARADFLERLSGRTLGHLVERDARMVLTPSGSDAP